MERIKTKEGGFIELKRQLSELYVPKRQKHTEDKFSIGHLMSRKQNHDESVSEFRFNLIEIAKCALPNVQMEQIDDELKNQFIYGIVDDKLREKVNMKLNKVTDILKNKMTMQELIKYAQVAEKSFQKSKLKQKAKK